MKTPVNIFISYSHVDTKYCEEFKKHMIGLERSGLAKPWTDHKISPGEKLDEKISDSIRNTDIMLLLVSVDFLNSDYCMSHEFKKALEKQNKEGNPIIIPIITRACDWKGIDEIKVLKALPTDGQSISSFRDPDQAYVEIVNSLRKIIESGTLNAITLSKEAEIPDDEEVKLYLTKILEAKVPNKFKGITYSQEIENRNREGLSQFKFDHDSIIFSADPEMGKNFYEVFPDLNLDFPTKFHFESITEELQNLGWLDGMKTTNNQYYNYTHYKLKSTINPETSLRRLRETPCLNG
ncbi:hypothetical protein CXU22_01365 [Akkermansia muciniphila]|uniref:TIR domain-containing protein n=1 Tax=Akkermansia muciniphila TaxID=239935 RepID=A0A2N8HG02_9BACT|nr:toll/interleukin-1 receptor domain-containing protein [Akkermansia muciniphila]PNC19690.1 hypothetical protein CXU22_01365 [Akkermansia muciniphila]